MGRKDSAGYVHVLFFLYCFSYFKVFWKRGFTQSWDTWMCVSAIPVFYKRLIMALGHWTFDLRIVSLLCMEAAVALAAQSAVLALSSPSPRRLHRQHDWSVFVWRWPHDSILANHRLVQTVRIWLQSRQENRQLGSDGHRGTINAGQQIQVARLTHKVQPSVKTLENPLEKRQCWNSLKKKTLLIKTSKEAMREKREEGRNRRRSP